MLKQIQNNTYTIKIKDATFPSPFKSGLEYSAPARGTWNIVHTGMLIPEAHQIFVCAASCLRGVVLTAAEMKAENRFSTIEIKENNVINGDMEQLIIDGVDAIITRLPQKPPAVLLYTSCIHHFLVCDMNYVFSELKSKYPDIDFTDCYMNPIMRKSGLTPDQIMRKQLYSLLKEQEKDDNTINIIGNDLKTDETSELIKIIKIAGYLVRDITQCKTYNEYQEMAKSKLNIVYYPQALPAAEELKNRFNQDYLYLPVSFDFIKIKDSIDKLTKKINGTEFNHEIQIKKCKEKLNKISSLLKDTEIAIDYTAVSKPFELAKLLTDFNIKVTKIYTDAISSEDKPSFECLKSNYPDIEIFPTVRANMCVIPKISDNKVLAIGQKAAYFNSTKHFVNIVEGGGHWGYDGILKLCDEIEEAYYNEKDTQKLIQIKGMGCGCC